MEIAADGDCMFSAISYQLGHEFSIANLRRIAADYQLQHEDEFRQFSIDPVTGKGLNEAEFRAHAAKIRNSKEWGGNSELVALSRALDLRITVILAESEIDLVFGEDECKRSAVITYHRHELALGEHYNATKELKS